MAGKMTFESDNRREFYTVNGDYLRVSAAGNLERFRMGDWEMVKASDYPNALLARLAETLNESLAADYSEEF